MRRAFRPDQKEIRRQAILACALQMFKEVPYAELRMADLAQRLGLGKGTLYLSFPTKEALFLAVLQLEMGSWHAGVGARLQRTPSGADPRQVAEGLVQELLDRPLLPKLKALLHNVLEQNVPVEEALAFGRFLERGVFTVGEELERVLVDLPKGQGAAFFIRFHSLVIGNQLMSSRPPVVQEALRQAKFSIFNFDFETVMRESAVDMLVGMLAHLQ
jgi:AcrR family transcriptional regulator